MIKPFQQPEILAVEDYYTLFGKPREEMNTQDETILKKFIAQATDQFDSYVSPKNQAGYLYRFWNALTNSDDDNMKGYKLQKAIGSWVETMIITGKFWVDGVPTMQSNIDYDIKTSSKDGRVELRRQDIIQDLVSIGVATQSNINGPTMTTNQQEIVENNFIAKIQNWVTNNFLRLDNFFTQGGLKSSTKFNANDLVDTGNLNGTFVGPNKYELQNYKLRNCDISFQNGNNINVENANKILDPNDGSFKFINQFTANYFGGLSKEEIYLAIQASGSLWQPQFVYQKGFVVMYKINDVDLYGYWESLVDNNTNNNPITSPDAWKQLPSSPTDINAVIQAVKEYVDLKYQEQNQQLVNTIVPNEVRTQLNALPTIDYVSEGNGELLTFENQSDFETYKTTMKVDDSYFQDAQLVNNDYFTIPPFIANSSENSINFWFDPENTALSLKFFCPEKTNKVNLPISTNYKIRNVNSSYNDFDFSGDFINAKPVCKFYIAITTKAGVITKIPLYRRGINFDSQYSKTVELYFWNVAQLNDNTKFRVSIESEEKVIPRPEQPEDVMFYEYYLQIEQIAFETSFIACLEASLISE